MKRLFLIMLLIMGYLGFSQAYPQMDTYTLVPTNAPTSPVEGQTYYDQTSKSTFVWNGTQWLNQVTVDTDAQTLNLTGNNLSLTNGGSVDLSGYLDDTDDQTALQVPFSPNGSIVATNVQDAIQEVRDEASTSSKHIISTANGTLDFADRAHLDFNETAFDVSDNASADVTRIDLLTDIKNRINNANKPPKTLNQTLGNDLASFETQISTGADIGRKVIHSVSAPDPLNVIVSNTGNVDDVWRFRTDDTNATINLIEGSGVTINSILSGDPDGVTISGFDQYIYLRKSGANTYTASGDSIAEYVALMNLYSEASAVNADNYSDALGSWTDQSGTSGDELSTSTSEVFGGSQGSIRFLDPTPGQFERAMISYTVTGGFVSGTSYTIEFDVKYVSGDGPLSFESRDSSDTGVVEIKSSPDNTWTHIAYTYTSDANGANEFWITPDRGVAGSGTDEFFFTNFQITQN